jgi:mono/diheme cytochrome c family protein
MPEKGRERRCARNVGPQRSSQVDMIKLSRSFVASGLLALAACAAGAATRGAGDEALSQAKRVTPRGARVYTEECAGCHGKRGEGLGSTPALMGKSTLARFRTAGDLQDYISKTMPLPKRRAGTLPPDDYWAVTGFVVEANGVALPEGELTPAAAANLSISH